MFHKDKCLRCGMCCMILIEGKAVPCKHLRFKPDKTTYCKVYQRRMRRTIHKGIKCILRRNTLYDFPNCLYNTGKPLFPMETS